MYKDFVNSIFIYGLAGSIGKFIGLLLMPIYVRIFSPEQYGIVDLIQTIVAIISIFGILLLESSIQRYYYEVKNELLRKKYITTTFWTINILSIFWLVIVILFAKTISSLLFADNKYYLPIIVAAISIPLSNLFVFCTVIIRYMKMPVKYLITVLIQLLLTVAFTFWFVIYLKLGIIGVFYAQILGLFISFVISLYVIRKSLLFYWNKAILYEMLAFALPQFPARIGSIANSYINRFIMLGYLTLTDIGIFTIAAKIASGFQLIENAFSLSWYPFFYEQLENNEEHRIVFRKICQYVVVFVFGLVGLFAFFAKEILMLLTTKDYYSALPIIGILALSNGLLIVKNAIDLGTLISKKTIYSTYIYLLSAVVNLIFLFILVPRIGLIGVPASLLICYLFLVIVSWIVSEKLYYIGFHKLYFAGSFSITLLLIFVAAYFELSISIKIILALTICLVGFIYLKKIKYLVDIGK